jgi:hypothetical protein
MEIKQIPKKSGGFRTIYVPNEEEKKTFREKLPYLHELQAKYCNPRIVHGFSKGHNIVTNAMQHVGKQYTTCFDIKDFFDSVSIWLVHRVLVQTNLLNSTEKVMEHGDGFIEQFGFCFIEGAARQGLPTSPLLANIAASSIDSQILKFINALVNETIIYTRYADDLTFSYDDPCVKDMLLRRIPSLLLEESFEINEKKTRTMSAKKGRRIITGIAVGEKDIYVPRRIKRKLRAAIHNKNRKTAIGFTEYCKLKLPRDISFEAFEKWRTLLFDRIKERNVARKSRISPLSLGVAHKEGN